MYIVAIFDRMQNTCGHLKQSKVVLVLYEWEHRHTVLAVAIY